MAELTWRAFFGLLLESEGQGRGFHNQVYSLQLSILGALLLLNKTKLLEEAIPHLLTAVRTTDCDRSPGSFPETLAAYRLDLVHFLARYPLSCDTSTRKFDVSCWSGNSSTDEDSTASQNTEYGIHDGLLSTSVIS
ncbi:hypothetical protein J6590_035054 [Homalodisca vitripennis]|nr:hypothetical protein J6590_035054 [Homalodisca vitripennis]